MLYTNKLVENIVKGIGGLDVDNIKITHPAEAGHLLTKQDRMLIRIGMGLGVGACIDVVGEAIEKGAE